MAKIIKVSLTEYYPFENNLTRREKRMEGGTFDRRGKPLYTLEDYVDGIAPYVSAACDSLGGAPGYVKEFRIYGFKAWLPKITDNISTYIDSPKTLPVIIEFRLVDTGGAFRGKTKKIRAAGYEPIDICRRAKPAGENSFSGLLTEMMLVGEP